MCSETSDPAVELAIDPPAISFDEVQEQVAALVQVASADGEARRGEVVDALLVGG